MREDRKLKYFYVPSKIKTGTGTFKLKIFKTFL